LSNSKKAGKKWETPGEKNKEEININGDEEGEALLLPLRVGHRVDGH